MVSFCLMKQEDVGELGQLLSNYIRKAKSEVEFLPKLIVPNKGGNEGIKKVILDGSYSIKPNSKPKDNNSPSLKKSKERNTRRMRYTSMGGATAGSKNNDLALPDII